MTVISKTCVSNADYCIFLNAVARNGDPFGVWNPLMSEHWWGGIEREEKNVDLDQFCYHVKAGYEKLPVTCVTWESAARYCNWLSFGKPDIGREALGTTEGNSDCGTYDTREFGTEEFVRSHSAIKRVTDNAYFLPTADEWRAAAFVGGDSGLVNVYDGHWARPFPHLSPVDDGCVNCLGCVNMRGNVGEWVESRRPGSNFFMALGGSLIRGKYSLEKDFIEGDESNKAISSFGFRVAHAENPVVISCDVGEKQGNRDYLALASPHIPPFAHGKENGSQGHTAQRDFLQPSWCLIGDEGNDRDSVYKVGRVDYIFEMAKYAVTNQDWCEFINKVGVERAVHLGLYNPDMTTGVCGGIDKISTADGNSHCRVFFRPKQGWGNRPVVYISFTDAMRYCNWLQTGDTETGAYDLEHPTCHRLSGAKFFIPTDDEWCKAAYYDPTRLGRRKYWDYPCRTDNLPPNDPTLPHACNYLRDGVYLGEKGPYYLAEVDAYPTSDTYYGCRQMAGNIWEWVEPVGNAKLNLRGTSLSYTEFGMGIWNRDEAGYEDELNVFGLRIARAVENPRVVKPFWGRLLKDWLVDCIV